MNLFKINDESRLMNLNYMEVYFSLSDEDFIEYYDLLMGMNHGSSITRGLFHFNVVKKGDQMYSNLPPEMSFMNYNVFVRLINSNHGMYCYGISYVALELDADRMRTRVDNLVDAICTENLNQLDNIQYSNRSTAISAYKRYKEAGIVSEIFERARNRQRVERIETRNGDFRPTDYVESWHDTMGRKESLDIAVGAVDRSKSAVLFRAEIMRMRPEQRPDISVTIKSVGLGKYTKNGREKTGYGFEFIIDGKVVALRLGSSDQTLLYAAVLLFRKNGLTLSRRSFTRECDSNSDDMIMLRRVYRAFSSDRSFEDWYAKVKEKDTQRINNALSKLNTALCNVLSTDYKDAVYYCSLNNENKGSMTSHYKVRIKSDNIHIDPIMEKRMQM